MSFSQRLNEIKTGFERPFWVANFTEVFERLSYYAAFASLPRYLHEGLGLTVVQSSTLAGLFGGAVWILAPFGGTTADRLGFRRALSLAYLILSGSYFLLGSFNAPWMGPLRNNIPLVGLATVILILPAFGIALVKPSVVGTTARASKENVRSIGYSIYYTLVNIGGAAGPLVASWVHARMSVEKVFLVSACSVFAMIFAVLFFFREPKRSDDAPPPTLWQAAKNFWTVITDLRFMLFLLIFSGYWIAYWQEFIILPQYVHDYIDGHADTERMLSTGPILVILLTVAFSILTQKMRAFRAIALGTLISALAFVFLIVHPSVSMAYATLAGIALGEITLSPRYYEYVSRLAPPGQQGTYLGFAFLPIGIGSIFGGPIGGRLMHYYGEVVHQPEKVWWVVTGIGVLTALLLWIYDWTLTPKEGPAKVGS
ncbi:MAG TPA: MFS transporter [Candidatus Angelobacter sp.]|nr:MFS transporter [Candidatus Angelobacter sp.]